MKKTGYIALICAAAMLITASGCQSEEVNAVTAPAASENPETAATTPAPAASTVSAADTTARASETAAAETTSVTVNEVVTSAASDPDETYETSMIGDFPVVVMTTSTQAAAVTKTTTVRTADVTTAPTSAEESVVSETTFLQKDFPDEDEISFEIISGADVITTKVPYISVRVKYIGNDTAFYYTTDRYLLEKFADGKWKNIPFSEEKIFMETACEISKESQPVIDITLEDEDYEEPITAGKYRVGIEIDSSVYYTEFEITDSSAEPEYELVAENGSGRFLIDEIREDQFVCELYFPYPDRYYLICDTKEYPDFCVGDYIEVDYSEMYMISDGQFRVIPAKISMSDFVPDPDVAYKPVIYLYPQEKTDISVKLDYNGRLTLTDPEYWNGWNVTAYPDGTIVSEGSEYQYLFWEGKNDFELDTSEGFCVRGEDTAAFLAEKLAYLGLNEAESREFMEFWLPAMTKNVYNVITFSGTDYTDNAKLDIKPTPDTVIRVFMTYSPSDSFVDIPAQQLVKAPGREGFTVVEWGGSVKE